MLSVSDVKYVAPPANTPSYRGEVKYFTLGSKKYVGFIVDNLTDAVQYRDTFLAMQIITGEIPTEEVIIVECSEDFSFPDHPNYQTGSAVWRQDLDFDKAISTLVENVNKENANG